MISYHQDKYKNAKKIGKKSQVLIIEHLHKHKQNQIFQ